MRIEHRSALNNIAHTSSQMSTTSPPKARFRPPGLTAAQARAAVHKKSSRASTVPPPPLWPKLGPLRVSFGQTGANLGERWSKLAKLGLRLAEAGPALTECRQIVNSWSFFAVSGHTGSKSDEFEPNLAEIARALLGSVPMLLDPGPILVEVAQFRVIFARNRAESGFRSNAG